MLTIENTPVSQSTSHCAHFYPQHPGRLNINFRVPHPKNRAFLLRCQQWPNRLRLLGSTSPATGNDNGVWPLRNAQTMQLPMQVIDMVTLGRQQDPNPYLLPPLKNNLYAGLQAVQGKIFSSFDPLLPDCPKFITFV